METTVKRKGHNFRHAKGLTFRSALPTDRTTDGGEIPWNYCVVVKTRSCLDENGEYSSELRRVAPMHGTIEGHSRTNMIYSGSWRKQNRHKWFQVQTKPSLNPTQFKAAEEAGDDNPEGWEVHLFDYYWTAPIYWIEDGCVFQDTRHRYSNPNGGPDSVGVPKSVIDAMYAARDGLLFGDFDGDGA